MRTEATGDPPIDGRPVTLVDPDDPKLHQPDVRRGIVPRTAILERLRASHDGPIVAIVAGPGYGKTSLLAQWANDDPRPFAWVSIDERDNDPAVLLTYIAAALARIEPIDAEAVDALASARTPIHGSIVARLGQAMSTIRRPFVLALDDLHLLDDADCRLAIAALARHVPPGSQLAVADREEVPLPVARLRTTDTVVEIGARDLAMNEHEASALLERSGLRLTDTAVATLARRTEGWPVGLYLAALSLRDERNVEAAVAAFAGDDRVVADYLWSEFLSRLSEDDRSFLTRTSVLEHLSGPLCDAVLEGSGSAERLVSLERSNLLLIPLNRQHTWFRYHHLLRDLLRSRLRSLDPAEEAKVLRRAAAWCERYGRPEMSVGYLQAAGDADGAARLVARLGEQPAYFGGRIGTLERWLAWFEDRGLIERYPSVAVIGAFTMALVGRPATAERWAEAAEHASGLSPDAGTATDARLALLRAFLCRNGPEEMRFDAEVALKLLPAQSPFRSLAVYLLGASSLLMGEDEDADALFADAAELASRDDADVLASVSWAQRGLLAIHAARWNEAEAHTGRAVAIVRDGHLEDHVASALAFVASARVATSRGDVAVARRELAEAQRLRPRLTHALSAFAVETMLELANAHVTLADPAGARVLLREISDLFHRRPHMGVLLTRSTELGARLGAIRDGAPGASTLTAAELRLLPYLPTHLTFREIGDQLNVSPHTVKTQAISIYRKFAVTSRGGAVRSARDLGLLG